MTSSSSFPYRHTIHDSYPDSSGFPPHRTPHPHHWHHPDLMPRSHQYPFSAAASFFDYPANHPCNPSPWHPDAENQIYHGRATDRPAAAPISAPYPENSQRSLTTAISEPIFTSVAVPIENELSRSSPHSPGVPDDRQWASGDLYVFETSSSSSKHASPAPSPPVKKEPEENTGCFIMELSPPQVETTLLSQSLAPPTEVPLRATQASKKMRGMMTVFRLNPFTMHNGEGRGSVPAVREEARPLEEEPLIFEFQLDIEGLHCDEPEELTSNEQLHSFSPEFELPEPGEPDLSNEGDHSGEWDDTARSDSAPYSTTPVSQWELEYPSAATTSAEDLFPRPDSASVGLHHSRHFSSRVHGSMSHPYPRRNAGRNVEPPSHHFNAYGSYVTENSSSSSLSAAVTNVNDRFQPNSHPEASSTTWSHHHRGNAYAPTLRSNSFDSGCHYNNPTVPIASVHRRLSLPETHQNLTPPFLAPQPEMHHTRTVI